jgi:hypothetical protein
MPVRFFDSQRPHEVLARPHTTKPVPEPAPVEPALALSDPERFVVFLTTLQLWKSIPAGRAHSRTAG